MAKTYLLSSHADFHKLVVSFYSMSTLVGLFNADQIFNSRLYLMKNDLWFAHSSMALSIMKRRGNPCGVTANVWDCDIVVSEFELQLPYYVHFRIETLICPLILPAFD